MSYRYFVRVPGEGQAASRLGKVLQAGLAHAHCVAPIGTTTSNDGDDDGWYDDDDGWYDDDDGWYDMAVVDADPVTAARNADAPAARPSPFQELPSDVLALILAAVNDPKPCKTVKQLCLTNTTLGNFCRDPDNNPFDAVNRALGWYDGYDTLGALKTAAQAYIETNFTSKELPVPFILFDATGFAHARSPKAFFKHMCAVKAKTDPFGYAELANQIDGSPLNWVQVRQSLVHVERNDLVESAQPLPDFPLKGVFAQWIREKYDAASNEYGFNIWFSTEHMRVLHWAIMVKRFTGTVVLSAPFTRLP